MTHYSGGDSFLKLEYGDDGIPVLAKGDVKPFGRLEHSGRFVAPEIASRRGHRLTEPGDYLLTTRDLTQAAEFLGLLAPVPPSHRYAVNQGANIVRFSSAVDSRYIVYWCNGPTYRAYMKAHYVGSTQIHVRKDDFLDAPLSLPPIEEQRAIAETLGALDDKIEVNSAIVSTIDTLSRSLVAEASANAQRQSLLSDLIEKATDIRDPKELNPETPYVGLDHMNRGSLFLRAWGSAGEVASAKAAFRCEDILFAKLRPYFKKVAIAPVAGVCSTDVLVLRPVEDGMRAFLTVVCASDDVIAYASSAPEGTRMPRVSWDFLGRWRVRIPEEDDMRRLEATLRPLLALGGQLMGESATLAATRDALLPRLLSGELRPRVARHLEGVRR